MSIIFDSYKLKLIQ